MSTVADLTGEVALDPNPFIGGALKAGDAWQKLIDKLGKGNNVLDPLEKTLKEFGLKAKGMVDPVIQAFETLGVKSQASLNKSASDAVQAFERIRTSGVATAKDIDNAYKAMEKAVASANQEIAKPQTGGFLAELGPKIKAAAGEMQIFGGVVAGVFGGAIAYATKASSDLSESVNAAEAVFKEAAGTVKEFANTSATSFGISRQAALQATASFGGMFTAMGLGRQASADLSVGVVALAADLVSLRNIQGGVAEGIEKVRSGLIGESEPLRRIGILVDDATVKHKSFEVGLKNAGGELSQQQKVLLRYLEILDQSEDAMGDFQRTSTGMANSSRILTAQFQDLAAALGDKFATAGNTAFGVGVQLMGVLNNLPGSVLAAAAAFITAGAAIGGIVLAAGTVVAILGGPVTLALVGVTAIVGTMAVAVVQNWERIAEATGGLEINWRSVFKAMAMAAGYLVDVISAVGRQVIMVFDAIVSGAKIMANGVVLAFNFLKQTLGGVLTAIATGDMVGFSVALSAGFSGALLDAGAKMSGDMKALGERLKGDMRATMGFLGGQTAKAFGDAFDKGVEAAKKFDYSKLRAQILDELKKLTGDLDKEGKKARKGGHDMGKAILDGFKEGIGGFGAAVTELLLNADKLAGLFDPMKKKQREASQELVSALKVVTEGVNQYLQSLGLTAKFTQEELAKMVTSGQDGLLGYVMAWKRAEEETRKAGVDLSKHITVPLKEINEALKAAGYDIEINEKMWAKLTDEEKKNVVAINDVLAAQKEFNRNVDATGDSLKHAATEMLDHSHKVNELTRSLLTGSTTFKEFINTLGKGTIPVVKLTANEIETLSEKFKTTGIIVANTADKIKEALDKDIRLSVARLELDTKSAIDSMISDYEQFAEHLGKTGKEFERFVEQNMRESLAKLPGMNQEAIDKIVEKWKQGLVQLPGIWEKAFGKLPSSLKGIMGDVFGIIDTMPGKWGDATRKITDTISQWISFADKILGLLSKISDSIPSNIGGVVDAIIGIFKNDKSTGAVGDAVGGLVKSATQSAAGAATAAGQAAGGAVTGGIASGIAAGTSSAVSAIAGVYSAMAQAVGVFASTFHDDSKAVRFAGGFLVGGPIGGILSAIFGGPSEFEKEKRKLTLDKMKADIASVYEDIKGTMVDVMQKGLTLLEGIADSNVIDMPRKAIKRFINKLGDILTLFVDLSKTFKGEALAQAKLVTDNLGGAIDLMLGGAQLIEAIRNLKSVSDGKIAEFIQTTFSIIDKWIAAVGEIEIKSAKLANKVSTKLTSSVELISKFPELINSIVTAAKITVTDAQLDQSFGTTRRIIDRFFALAEDFAGYALNKVAKTGDRFKQVFDAVGSIFTGLAGISEYKPIGETIFDALAADVAYILKKMVEISQAIEQEMLGRAAEMSADLTTVFGLIKTAFESLASLDTYKSIASDSFDALGVDIRLAVSKMGEIADAIGLEAAEKAGKFADSAGRVIAIIKNAVESFNALDSLQNVEEGPFNALEIYIRRSIELMARISGSMTDALMQEVETFSNKTKAVFDALRSAVGVFVELSNLSGGRDQAGANFPGIGAAFEGLVQFTETAVLRLGELAHGAASEMVDDALLFATKAKVIFESVTAGANSIKAIGELKDAPFNALVAFTTGFADAISKMAELVGASVNFGNLAGTFRDNIEAAVRDLREGVLSLATVLTGTQGFGGGQNLTLEQSVLAGNNNSLGLSAAGSSTSSQGTNAIHLHFHGPVIHDQQFKTLVRQANEESSRRWL
jgi:hypothetical protein